MEYDNLEPCARALRQTLCGDVPTAGRGVRFVQRGEKRISESSPWQSFSARQWISIERCEFDRKARTGPAGAIVVRDRLVAGLGSLDVKLFDLAPLMRAPAWPN